MLPHTTQAAILETGVDEVWRARLARGDPFEAPLQTERVNADSRCLQFEPVHAAILLLSSLLSSVGLGCISCQAVKCQQLCGSARQFVSAESYVWWPPRRWKSIWRTG